MRLRILIPLLLCALALTSVAAGAPTRGDGGRAVRAGAGTKIARFARSFIGVPYSYGGSTPRNGFDCSGLVAYVFEHFGVDLPHYTVAQFGHGRRISRGGLRPGDLVFFAGLSHVGIYVGHGRFVHAPHTGTRVQIASLGASWYRSEFDGGRRISARTNRHDGGSLD